MAYLPCMLIPQRNSHVSVTIAVIFPVPTCIFTGIYLSLYAFDTHRACVTLNGI